MITTQQPYYMTKHLHISNTKYISSIIISTIILYRPPKCKTTFTKNPLLLTLLNQFCYNETLQLYFSFFNKT